MNKHFVAARLRKLAKMILAFSREGMKKEIDSMNLGIEDEERDAIIDLLIDKPQKEQKAALFWLKKRNLFLDTHPSWQSDRLKKEAEYLDKVFDLMERKGLNFQSQPDPEKILSRDLVAENKESTVDTKSHLKKQIKDKVEHRKSAFSLQDALSKKLFFDPYNAGDGVMVYEVKETREGMEEVRKAVDAMNPLGNPWCLISRKSGVADSALEEMSEEQRKLIGLDEEDETLEAAWFFWHDTYDAYPKRVAFRGGKIFSICANSDKTVLWFDMRNMEWPNIPDHNCTDDQSFIDKHHLKIMPEEQAAELRAKKEKEREERSKKRAEEKRRAQGKKEQ